MHKGYTLNYFINFFSSINAKRWTTGKLVDYTSGQCCALGFAGLGSAKLSSDELKNCSPHDELENSARAAALRHFISSVPSINDGAKDFRYLGKTPKQRIVKALKLRKKGFTNLRGKPSKEV